MKLFSKFNESNNQVNEVCTTADANPGNSMQLGVTNHLTPVQNIVTNVRNLFSILPIVVAVAEDGFSVKINSSEFISQEKIDRIMYDAVWQNQSLYSYICAQGLDKMSVVNLGSFYVVYVSPSDVNATAPGLEPNNAELPCKENFEEVEIVNMVVSEGNDDDEEIEVLTKKNIHKILDSKDKVKAAKQLAIIVAQQISLPTEYYFAGVRSKDGDESIALRWKHIKRRPHGKSAEVTHTLMNIFGIGDDAVWVGDFDKKSIFNLPEETKKLIDTILEMIGAEKTSDVCIFKIEDESKKKDTTKDDEDTEDKKKEDSEDSEDNDSRGDSSDDLDI